MVQAFFFTILWIDTINPHNKEIDTDHHKVTSHKARNTPVEYPILDCKPDTREFRGNQTIQYSQRRSEERNIHWKCLIARTLASWH